MKLQIFPNEIRQDSKWKQFTIEASDLAAPIMEQIIRETSGLVRIDDLQTIAKILHRELTSLNIQQTEQMS